ncbi:hypothetical protein CSH63_24975 [Micromonospora tulbaghiae]|uniref:Uncharacterized protein n=1 Tax=Micromonospora tulbaghiae TaxID=479978 RepID=A0A386WSM5_9ACTN|nr:hypothetical protein [Micromonospora tulbaghiae]AYF30638.1 hypothetical protein CSH63_24975 [Micromonospora tulbaghiae]
MSLHPTKTRIALLDQVRTGNVFRDSIGESYISGDRKVTYAIHEMQAAGWVALDPAGPLDYWQLTDAGREVLDAEATRYRVEFARVGRNHNVSPFGPIVSGPDHTGRLAEAIHRYAGRHLGSRFYTVDVDLAAGKGWIEGGRFGTFTVTRVGAEL